MTSVQMHELFNIIQDKYNSPWFLEAEVDVLLNTAQTNFVNDILFKEILGRKDIPKGREDLSQIERSVREDQVLEPITILNESITPSSGVVTLSSLVETLIYVLSIRRASDDLPVRYIRMNDLGKFSQNSFKAPSSNKLYYNQGNGNLSFYPTSQSSELLLSYIKEPAAIAHNTTDSELPSFTHNDIVARAIELAGIATFDEALTAISEV